MKLFVKILIPLLLISTLIGCTAVEAPQPTAQPSEPEAVSPTTAPENTQAVELPAKNLQSALPRSEASASDTDIQNLASGLNQFAVDVYREMGQQGSENLFFSPYSISLALTMAYAGADGQTAAEMADVFHYPASLSDLHGTMNALDQSLYVIPDYLEDDPDSFKLNISNAIWGQAGYPFSDDYLDTIAQSYGAGLKTMDFKTAFEKARQEINAWVEDETEQKIKDLLPPGSLGPDTRMVLTNAIYFNAGWENEFSENMTEMKDFYPTTDQTTQVEMMQQESSFSYYQTDAYRMLEMPYRNNRYGMVLVMPTEQNLTDFQQNLRFDDLMDGLDSMASEEVRLSMPKFEFDYELAASDILRALGMQAAFSPQEADFSKMVSSTEEPLVISDVLHKAFVSVDETGTEAAAATAVVMRTTSIEIQEDEPITVVFDHPFMFLIRDQETGIILFMGNYVGE